MLRRVLGVELSELWGGGFFVGCLRRSLYFPSESKENQGLIKNITQNPINQEATLPSHKKVKLKLSKKDIKQELLSLIKDFNCNLFELLFIKHISWLVPFLKCPFLM